MRGVVATPFDYAHDARTRERWIEGLAQLIGFPTVSGRRAYRAHLDRCAAWLAEHLRAVGMQQARVLPGVAGGAPSVYADWLGAPGQPTVLLYGHYDVQPAEPLAAWSVPPFRATVRNGRIYGRGSSDDKGQLYVHLCALEAYLATSGRLPINVKIWIEGEEEVASPTIERVFDRYADLFRASAAIVSDTEIAGNQPSIIYGLRGALPFELNVSTAKHELHSGHFGGSVLEPIQQVCRFVAGIHDAGGRIQIPGFMQGVRRLPWGERMAVRRNQHDDVLLREAGAIASPQVDGYAASELARIRPAITLHGIEGGSSGPSLKSVVPTSATVRGSRAPSTGSRSTSRRNDAGVIRTANVSPRRSLAAAAPARKPRGSSSDDPSGLSSGTTGSPRRLGSSSAPAHQRRHHPGRRGLISSSWLAGGRARLWKARRSDSRV